MCLFFDVYKIASNHSLEISLLGRIENITDSFDNKLKINEKYNRNTLRRKLCGLELRCGFVVC